MTAPFLISELTTLISESKRKAPELRAAADNSLTDLKALPVTSEVQLSTDLSRRPHFPDPFLLACNSKNAKLAAIGIACLQRLCTARAVPRERLKDFVQSLKECASLSLEIQLKTLQILPILTTNYAQDVKGDVLFTLLHVCSTLQASRTAALSGTASATQQQLVLAIFDKLRTEDRKSLEVPTVAEVAGLEGSVAVRAVAYDAYRVLSDVCMLIASGTARDLKLAPIPETVLLELVETILANNPEIVISHPEQLETIRATLLPFLTQTLAEKQSFGLLVRVSRVVCILIRNYHTVFVKEVRAILGMLHKLLDLDQAQNWRRVIALEILRAVVVDYRFIIAAAQESDQSSLQDCLNSFVRLASEKPAIIGLSQVSTIPIGNYFQRELNDTRNADDSSNQASASTGVATAAVPGISQQWSAVKTACLDQLDKADAPNLPETYTYLLVIQCLNAVVESLARFIIPLTVPPSNKTRKKNKTEASADTGSTIPTTQATPANQSSLETTPFFRTATVPINPLKLENHPASAELKTASAFIDQCWPAVLACCSTFLYSSLDNDFYRMLIRMCQKFTQTIGLLQLPTPRDAFLTTLGKAAVPASILTAALSPMTPKVNQMNEHRGILNVESLVNQAAGFLPDLSRQSAVEFGANQLNARNLLCLRALVNLAIALGPTLDKSWSIIFETIQQADNVMAVSSFRPSSRDRPSTSGSEPGNESSSTSAIATEIAAVQSAASRMFESTADYPNEAFKHILKALCDLLVGKNVTGSSQDGGTSSPKISRRQSSFSGISIKTEAHARDPLFALAKIRDVAVLNLHRFAAYKQDISGWQMLVSYLVSFILDEDPEPAARYAATDIVSRLTQRLIGNKSDAEPGNVEKLALQSLEVLSQICTDLQTADATHAPTSTYEVRVRIHSICLNAFQAIIERVGDTLESAWPLVLDIVRSVFTRKSLAYLDGVSHQDGPQTIDPELLQIAFGSVQLICSDFLESLPISILEGLLSTLALFAAQDEDLNVALTTSGAIWTLSDHLYSRVDHHDLDQIARSDARSNIFDLIQDLPTEPTLSLLWYRSLIYVGARGHDSRVEVRNSAIQATLRVFHSHGSDLSANVWLCCLQSLWIPLISGLLDRYAQVVRALRSARTLPPDAEDIIEALVSSANILFSGISSMSSDFVPKCQRSQDFQGIWEEIIRLSSSFLDLELFDITARVYDAVNAMVVTLADEEQSSKALRDTAFEAWARKAPASSTGLSFRRANTANVKALESYVTLFPMLYKPLAEPLGTVRLQKVSDNFYNSVINTTRTAYSPSADNMTPLQTTVVQDLRLLKQDPRAWDPILDLIGKVLILTLPSIPDNDRIHYIALAKELISLSVEIVEQDRQDCSLATSPALQAVLTALSSLIEDKEQVNNYEKQSKLWRVAAAAIVPVATISLSTIDGSDPAQLLIQTARRIIFDPRFVELSDGVSFDRYLDDEAFETQQLSKLHPLLLSRVATEKSSSTDRKDYIRVIFEGSFIHNDQLAGVGQAPSDLLDDLYDLRHGSTQPPKYIYRMEMAYQCLDYLIETSSVANNTPDNVRLAKVATPYMVLRAALPLRAFIANQPLRGRMPQPSSERHELLVLLNLLKNLKSEPSAIPDIRASTSSHRKHIAMLFPLLTKALPVARYDTEMMGALQGCLDTLYEDS